MFEFLRYLKIVNFIGFTSGLTIEDGIFYIPPRKSDFTKMVAKKVEFEISGEKKRIVEIFPEKYLT